MVCWSTGTEQPTDLLLRSVRRSAGKSPQAPRLGPHHSGPPARPTRPRAASAARRALAGYGRVSVEGAGTGEHHMPALPSKGESRDLSFAASIPVSAYGVVKRLGSPDEEQRSGGSQTSSELAMARASALRAKRTNRSPARATKHRWQGHWNACLRNLLANER